MVRRTVILYLVTIVAVVGGASAQSPEWRYGGRISWVDSKTTSEELGETGSSLELDSGLGVEFDATVIFSDRFGIELSAGASAPRFRLTGEEGSVDGGRVWLVPLSAIAQYHHPVYGPWDPYVGLGISWVVPIYKLSGDLEDSGVERLEIDGGFGGVAQIGTNYQMDNRWYMNIDLRYFGTSMFMYQRLSI